MALVVKDRVRETSTTGGTGTIIPAGAVSGFQSFAVIGDGNTTYYTIVDSGTGSWEVGVGTYTAAGTSLSRDTVLESSNGGALVNFGTNPKDVFVTYPAERSVYTDAAGNAITPATTSTLGVTFGGTGISSLAANQIPYGNNTSAFQSSANLTFDGTTLATTTVDSTNIEVTNIKAKDGTSSASIADSTGVMTVTNLAGTTANITTVNTTNTNATTVDTTNLEATNIKAKDGTAVASIADSTGIVSFSTTNAVTLPAGTDGQRPTGVAGMLRFNTDSDEFEGYNGTAWASVGGAAITNDTATSTDVYPLFADATSGTAATVYTSNAKLLYKPSTGELKATAPVAANGILVNNTTATENYTIASGSNGLTVGPITVDSGVTITVSSGQRWLVL